MVQTGTRLALGIGGKYKNSSVYSLSRAEVFVPWCSRHWMFYLLVPGRLGFALTSLDAKLFGAYSFRMPCMHGSACVCVCVCLCTQIDRYEGYLIRRKNLITASKSRKLFRWCWGSSECLGGSLRPAAFLEGHFFTPYLSLSKRYTVNVIPVPLKGP